MSYGNTIKRLLGMHCVTQAELAKWVGVAPQTMTAIVKDQANARMDTYERVFGFFDVEPTKRFETILEAESLGRYWLTESRIADQRKTDG